MLRLTLARAFLTGEAALRVTCERRAAGQRALALPSVCEKPTLRAGKMRAGTFTALESSSPASVELEEEDDEEEEEEGRAKATFFLITVGRQSYSQLLLSIQNVLSTPTNTTRSAGLLDCRGRSRRLRAGSVQSIPCSAHQLDPSSHGRNPERGHSHSSSHCLAVHPSACGTCLCK